MTIEGNILPIVIHGDPVLHNRAAEVEEINNDIRQLVADMHVTQEAARGVGLAAPQVGVGLRIFTWEFENTDDAPTKGEVLNPVLTLLGKVSQEEPDPETETEGCLSVPALGYPLKRSDHVRLQGFDVNGDPIDFEAYDWFARILQHEFDHLNATLYVNRLNTRWSKRWKKELRKQGWTAAGNTWMPGEDSDPFGHDDDQEEEAEASG